MQSSRRVWPHVVWPSFFIPPRAILRYSTDRMLQRWRLLASVEIGTMGCPSPFFAFLFPHSQTSVFRGGGGE
ncbi:hypothetical protein P167DRAFT_121447 [Morchella conica CCBAS932]|uniref:Uncharacterized protein n=1 Tax=Morchella conica CCBAS932 TaxID=1392247 RepID=A0A3N4L3T1_9PEZI|nr:hypothetical protein P167DRAFT_121447 [Morchella conica CCBAS932]